MNIKVAQSAVSDSRALLHNGSGVVGLSEDTKVRKWENVSPIDISDAVQYLRLYTAEKNGTREKMSVSDLALQSATLDGVWRGGKVYSERDDDGKHTVYQELHKGFVQTVKKGTSYDFSEFIKLDGHLRHSGSLETTLMLPNVDPAKVDSIRDELQESTTFTDFDCKYESIDGEHYYLDSIPKPEEDGSFSILMTLCKMPDPLSYIVVGSQKTDFYNDDKRIYEDIPGAYVTTLINSIVTLGDCILIDGAARKSSTSGLFDIYLTLRTLVVPPGGLDVIIGGSWGLFGSEQHMLRNVRDVDVDATVQGLIAMDLVSNVKATGGRSPGFWDVIYTLLVVPASRIEIKKSDDRKETSYSLNSYTLKEVYSEYTVAVNSDSTASTEKMWIPTLKSFKNSGGFTSYGKQIRTVTVTKVISYSVNRPSTPEYGSITMLSNGLWQLVTEDVSYPWWSDTDYE